ncbi:hypothetical protein FS837_012844 [Tulasnella sp. UAMH 9824]|nr:hypothetical protein FS837_012844 [Tulasnella sp. UAMH 9824]
MSGGSRPTFRGSSAAEAEDFVQAVRRKAWAEQKQFDYRWMAAYAAVQMSGQALRWHMSLPRDIQSDWGRLEVAILDRFAPDQPQPALSNNPMVPNGASAEPVLCTGRIRVTEYVTGRFVGYISKSAASQGSSGFAVDTTNRADDALLVEFRPSASLVTFDLVDKSNFHRLALRLHGEKLDLSTDGSEYRYLYIISLAPGPKPGSIRYSYSLSMGQVAHVQHAVWQVDADGSITPVWPSTPQVKIGGLLSLPPNDSRLSLRTDITTALDADYMKKAYMRAKLEFEHA